MTSTASSSGKQARANKVAAGSAAAGKGGPAQGGRRASHGTSRLMRHDFWIVCRQVAPIALVALAVFTAAIPVSTSVIPDISIFNVDFTHDQLKFRFWAEALDYPVVLGSALAGLVLGIRSFRFLLVKREATAVLSLPLSRAQIFATRFGAAALACVLSIGLPMLVSLVLNVAALNIWSGLFSQFAYVLAGLLVSALLACAVGALACAVAGTVFEAAALSVALLAGVTVAMWGMNVLMQNMLVGNAFGATLLSTTHEVAPALVAATAVANPLLFFSAEASAHQLFKVQHPVYYPPAGNWQLVAVWAVAMVVVVLLARMLFRRRHGERAGIAGLSLPLTLICGIVLGLAAFGGAFTLLASLNLVAAVVVSFMAFWIVSAVLMAGPFKGPAPSRQPLIAVAAESAALACVLAAVGTGGLGYAQAVPEDADVESVSISCTGTPSYLAVPFQSATAGDGAFYVSASYTYDDAAAIDLVRDVHRKLTVTGGQPLAEASKFSDTVIPYDVVVHYQLKNGGELVRYYDRASLGELEQLAELDGTSRAGSLTRATVSGDTSLLSDDDASALANSTPRQAYAMGDTYLSDPLYAAPQLLNCDAQARSELLSALAEDAAKQPVEDRYHPQGACRGVLMFTQRGDVAADTFDYSIDNAIVYLTDSYTQTLAWLDAKGLSGYLVSPGADEIESMTFQRYSPYEGMNDPSKPLSAYFMSYKSNQGLQFITTKDFGTKYTEDDPEKIAELLPLCRNSYFMDDGGILASCKLKGQDAYTYLFIPNDAAPKWLARVVG